MADSRLHTAWWWVVTLAVLIVLDDLTWGPLFWLLTAFAGESAIVITFVIYVCVQLYVVLHGIRDQPGRLAGWVLDRLQLARSNEEIAVRETALHERVTGTLLAAVLALVIGGILPPLLLWKRGWPRSAVVPIAVLTAAVYSAEFAFLHSYIPSRLF